LSLMCNHWGPSFPTVNWHRYLCAVVSQGQGNTVN